MKMFKKLIPAVAMLVLSAAMVVTSSFAWFSVNSTVNVTGMQVKARADQMFLQIITSLKEDGSTNAFDNSAQTSATAVNKENGSNTTFEFTPARLAAANFVPTEAAEGVEGTKKEDVPAYAGTDSFTWLTALSDDPSDSTATAGSYKVVSDTTNYALKNTFKIRLNPLAGQTQATGSLQVAGITIGGTADDIRASLCVLVVNKDTHQSELWTQTAAGTFTRSALGNNNLSGNEVFTSVDGAETTIEVYVFFDGEHENCKTNNVKTNAYTVSLSFDCNGAVTPAQN